MTRRRPDCDAHRARIFTNVRRVVKEILNDEPLHEVNVVGARYDLETGKVEWLK